MSRAYELFYANHSLESKMESCALCFQAAETSRISKNVCLSCHQMHFYCCIFFFQCPRFSACVCGLVDGRAQLSRANNWRNTLRYLEFKMTSTHHCVLYRNVRNKASFSMYVRKWASLLWEQTANPELSVMILSFFSSVELHMNSQGTSFSELNICTCFTSLYFRTLLPPRRLPHSCFLFLWGLKGQRALAEGEKRERRGDHEPEIYDCVDLPLWGWSLWIHLDFVLWRCCPASAIGYRALCKDTERHAF